MVATLTPEGPMEPSPVSCGEAISMLLGNGSMLAQAQARGAAIYAELLPRARNMTPVELAVAIAEAAGR